MKDRLEEANDLSEQNFEERTKSFILRAQQRFELLEKKRKRSEGKVSDDLVWIGRIKRQVESREESPTSETSTESSNPLESLFNKVKSQSGKIATDLRETWSETWNKTVEVVSKGVSQIQESAKGVGENLEKRWDTLKDSASKLRSNSTDSIEEFSVETQGDSKKEEKPIKGGLIERIRGLFSSDR